MTEKVKACLENAVDIEECLHRLEECRRILSMPKPSMPKQPLETPTLETPSVLDSICTDYFQETFVDANPKEHNKLLKDVEPLENDIIKIVSKAGDAISEADKEDIQELLCYIGGYNQSYGFILGFKHAIRLMAEVMS